MAHSLRADGLTSGCRDTSRKSTARPGEGQRPGNEMRCKGTDQTIGEQTIMKVDYGKL